MVKISNDFLDVMISEQGAELKSIKNKAGEEFLWIGDPNVWAGQAPVMFPICGGLKDDKYVHNGKEYTLKKHGFARHSKFEIIRSEKDYAAFLLTPTDETKAMYPFDYEFVVSFKLDGNKIAITYAAKNLGTDDMYVSFGCHEAYYCPEDGGIENYKVVFDKPVTLKAYDLDGNLVKHSYNTVLENGTELDLDYKYFAIDALVFRDIPFQAMTLAYRNGEKKLRVDFEGFNYCMLWTKPNAKYICIEPWAGTPDPVDADGILANKMGINKVKGGDTFALTHTITIF